MKLLYDNRILLEDNEVLNRKKFNFKREWIEPLIDFIRNEGEFIIVSPINKSFKECHTDAEAQSLIIILEIYLKESKLFK